VSNFAIRVENLSKLYRIGQYEYHKTLRESIMEAIFTPFHLIRAKSQRANSPQTNEDNTIWALKDVSFEVKQGEVVGIIGRNGAGKTTLLKILSSITEPTSGRAQTRGRLGSLLEIGTGFHPELTGRENIYLNGVILGMKRSEIGEKFDEIVAFAEIEKFLDTPVKRYSTGMYVRLAFSVAAHLEPEILLVDEVLAVGDATFQKKCIGKMGDIAHEGRTVLFVSHNMGAIGQLCKRTVWLDGGQVKKIGPTYEIIHDYLNPSTSTIGTWHNSLTNEVDSEIKLVSASISTKGKSQTGIVRFDEGFNLEIDYEIQTPIGSPWTLVFRVSDSSGVGIFTSWDIDSIGEDKPKETGRYCAICHVPGKILRPGTYSVSLGIYFTNTNMHISNFHEHLFYFEISSVGYTMNANRGGIITPILPWSIERSHV